MAVVVKSRRTRRRREPRVSLDNEWLRRAALLPGRTLHYAMALLADAVRKQSPEVRLGAYDLQRWGVTPDAASDSLTRMVAAGLVRADRRRGRRVTVFLLRVDEDNVGDTGAAPC